MSEVVKTAGKPGKIADGSVAGAQMDEHTKKILAVKTLMRERQDARKNNDFTKSDHIRDKLLIDFGVEIFDQKNGPSGWKFQDGSSKKLAAGLTLPVEVTETLKRNREESAGDKPIEKKQKVAAAIQKPSKVIKEAVLSEEQKRNKLVMNTIMGSDGPLNKQGVLIEELVIGSSKIQAKSGQRIKVHYVGRLKSNNKMFDSSLKKPFQFRLGRSEVIKGWDIGCEGMFVGGKRRLTIPPEKAYGRQGAPPSIPSNATLVFEVTLLEVLG